MSIQHAAKTAPCTLISLVATISLCHAPSALADIEESELKDYVGYRIAAVMHITGWYDTQGEKKKGDSFEGCEFGRVIILDDRKAVTCNTYSYSYSYRPLAVILTDGSSYVMIVNGHFYSVRK